MSLQAQLDQMKEDFEKEAPPRALVIMHQATEDLRNSGIMDLVVGESQQAPDFTLDDSRGHPTALSRLCSDGPVVLIFFRGDW